MTKAIFTCKSGRIVCIQCNGHTGYAQSGSDIVCAAISSILQTAALGVLQVVGVDAQYITDDKKGSLRLQLGDDMSPQQQHDVQIVLQTALAGTRDIVESYPQFVKLEVKEL